MLFSFPEKAVTLITAFRANNLQGDFTLSYTRL
jgi:hypothetical protein